MRSGILFTQVYLSRYLAKANRYSSSILSSNSSYLKIVRTSLIFSIFPPTRKRRYWLIYEMDSRRRFFFAKVVLKVFSGDSSFDCSLFSSFFSYFVSYLFYYSSFSGSGLSFSSDEPSSSDSSFSEFSSPFYSSSFSFFFSFFSSG